MNVFKALLQRRKAKLQIPLLEKQLIIQKELVCQLTMTMCKDFLLCKTDNLPVSSFILKEIWASNNKAVAYCGKFYFEQQ